MPSRHLHILLNANAGTVLAKGVTAENLMELFEAAGHRVTIDANTDEPLLYARAHHS